MRHKTYELSRPERIQSEAVVYDHQPQSETGPSNSEIITSTMSLMSILLCGAEVFPHAVAEVLEPVDVVHTVLDIEHDDENNKEKR